MKRGNRGEKQDNTVKQTLMAISVTRWPNYFKVCGYLQQ